MIVVLVFVFLLVPSISCRLYCSTSSTRRGRSTVCELSKNSQTACRRCVLKGWLGLGLLWSTVLQYLIARYSLVVLVGFVHKHSRISRSMRAAEARTWHCYECFNGCSYRNPISRSRTQYSEWFAVVIVPYESYKFPYLYSYW